MSFENLIMNAQLLGLTRSFVRSERLIWPRILRHPQQAPNKGFKLLDRRLSSHSHCTEQQIVLDIYLVAVEAYWRKRRGRVRKSVFRQYVLKRLLLIQDVRLVAFKCHAHTQKLFRTSQSFIDSEPRLTKERSMQCFLCHQQIQRYLRHRIGNIDTDPLYTEQNLPQ